MSKDRNFSLLNYDCAVKTMSFEPLVCPEFGLSGFMQSARTVS